VFERYKRRSAEVDDTLVAAYQTLLGLGSQQFR